MELHIGNEIYRVYKTERNIGAAELAGILETSAQNLNSIFKRKSIDTEMLYKISVALSYNFFDLYRKPLVREKGMEGSNPEKEIEKLREELAQTKSYLDVQIRNSVIEQKYIAVLEEKIANLEGNLPSDEGKKGGKK